MSEHSPTPSSRLTFRIVAVVVAAALVVAGGVALLLSDTTALRGSAQSEQRADSYLTSVINVEGLVVDAETGLRGEVITDRTVFLQPLYRAQTAMPGAIAAVQRAASQNHSYERQSEGLIAAVRSYMSSYVQHVIGLVAHDLSKARSFSVTLQGKHLVDVIRTRVAQLESSLSRSQTARGSTARHTANTSIADGIVVLVLLTLFTAALGGYLGRLVVGRERAREQSEATTRTLQQSILPSVLPEIPGCELATRFIPGRGAVSGDFYDALALGQDEWAVIIGDVCGKGAAAAAATAMARWTLRTTLAEGAAPDEALRLLNSLMLQHDGDAQFITAACLRITLESDAANVMVACAGHPAPILVPRVGPPVTAAAKGDLLGILPTIRLRTAELALRPGDSVVAYTDGVTDQGPEVRRAPKDALAGRGEENSAADLIRILEDVATHPTGPHPDDIAIVALRFLGSASPVIPLQPPRFPARASHQRLAR